MAVQSKIDQGEGLGSRELSQERYERKWKTIETSEKDLKVESQAKREMRE